MSEVSLARVGAGHTGLCVAPVTPDSLRVGAGRARKTNHVIYGGNLGHVASVDLETGFNNWEIRAML